MKLFATLMLTAMLVPAGAVAMGPPDERYGERPSDPRGHAEDIFLIEVPRGAEMARKGERVMGLEVDEFVGTPVVKQHTGEQIGKVKGVIVDANDEAMGFVLNIDNLPGVDQRDVAVERDAVLTERDEMDRLVVQLAVTAGQLRHAPPFVGGS